MGVVSTLFAALADRCRCLPFGTHREVLHTVLIIGSRPAGEHAVGLEPEELRPSRPDATGSRSEAAAAEHRGDGRGRYVYAELEELAPDP